MPSANDYIRDYEPAFNGDSSEEEEEEGVFGRYNREQPGEGDDVLWQGEGDNGEAERRVPVGSAPGPSIADFLGSAKPPRSGGVSMPKHSKKEKGGGKSKGRTSKAESSNSPGSLSHSFNNMKVSFEAGSLPTRSPSSFGFAAGRVIEAARPATTIPDEITGLILKFLPLSSLLMARLVSKTWRGAADGVFSWKGVFNLGLIDIDEETSMEGYGKLRCPDRIGKDPAKVRQSLALALSLDEGIGSKLVESGAMSPFYRVTAEPLPFVCDVCVDKTRYSSKMREAGLMREHRPSSAKAGSMFHLIREGGNLHDVANQKVTSVLPLGNKGVVVLRQSAVEVWRWFNDSDALTVTTSPSSAEEVEQLNNTPFHQLNGPQLRLLMKAEAGQGEILHELHQKGPYMAVVRGDHTVDVYDVLRVRHLLDTPPADISRAWVLAAASCNDGDSNTSERSLQLQPLSTITVEGVIKQVTMAEKYIVIAEGDTSKLSVYVPSTGELATAFAPKLTSKENTLRVGGVSDQLVAYTPKHVVCCSVQVKDSMTNTTVRVEQKEVVQIARNSLEVQISHVYACARGVNLILMENNDVRWWKDGKEVSSLALPPTETRRKETDQGMYCSEIILNEDKSVAVLLFVPKSRDTRHGQRVTRGYRVGAVFEMRVVGPTFIKCIYTPAFAAISSVLVNDGFIGAKTTERQLMIWPWSLPDTPLDSSSFTRISADHPLCMNEIVEDITGMEYKVGAYCASTSESEVVSACEDTGKLFVVSLLAKNKAPINAMAGRRRSDRDSDSVVVGSDDGSVEVRSRRKSTSSVDSAMAERMAKKEEKMAERRKREHGRAKQKKAISRERRDKSQY